METGSIKGAVDDIGNGGAGFIGANFVLDWLAESDETVINLDSLTYAGNLDTMRTLEGDQRQVFVHGDIGDTALVAKLLAQYQPRAVVNFAAESHVDRSIDGPGDFIHTNIVGTFHLLEAVRAYWNALEGDSPAISHAACVSRRGVWFVVEGRVGVYRNPSLRAEQFLFGQQGGKRSSCARLSPHI